MRNESILADHEDILQEKKKTIEDKNKEIALLKQNLEKVKNKTLETLDTEILESTSNKDNTTSQDALKTPQNNKKLEYFVTPYTPPKTSTTMETIMKSVEDNIKEILEKLQTITIIKQHDPSKPAKPSNTTSSETVQSQVKTQPSKLSCENDTITVLNKNTAATATIEVEQHKKKKKYGIFILGDSHLKNFRTTLSKNIPNEWIIQESIIPDGTIPNLCAKDDKHDVTHLIFMAGSNDIQKTPMKDIKKSLDTLFQEYKSSMVHFIQIPYRYDNINHNYHIEQVNNTLENFVLNYENVVLYKTKTIIENWDYSDKTSLNQNGVWKICKELRKSFYFVTNGNQRNSRAPENWQPKSTNLSRKPRTNFHPVSRQYSSNNNLMKGQQFNNQHTRYTRPVSKPYQRYSYDYDYDTLFPPYRQRNNFRY